MPSPLAPPRRFAFFDVDGTLISLKSMLSFQDYWLDGTGDAHERAAFQADFAALKHSGAPREELNRAYYRHFAGRPVDVVAERASGWFAQLDPVCLWHRPVVSHLRRHQAEGCEAVFVSGSFPALLAPLAQALGVRHILAARLEQQDGRYTGILLPPQTIGSGKADAITAFLAAEGARPEHCHAYGDDISDRPMLEVVGHAHVVRGDAELEALAERRGWPVVDPYCEVFSLSA